MFTPDPDDVRGPDAGAPAMPGPDLTVPPVPTLQSVVVPAARTSLLNAQQLLAGNEIDAGSPAASLSLARLLAGFRRRWAIGLALGVICGGAAAAAVLFLMPPRFTVQTLLQVSASKPSILGQSQDTRLDFMNYQKTQLVMVKSKLVLNTALRQPGVVNLRVIRSQPDPIIWLERQIAADFYLAPEILRISMTGDEPAELAILVNAVREAYLREVVNKERIERHAQYEHLQKLYGAYDDILKTHRRTLHELARAVGSRNTETLAHKQRFAQERLGGTQRELLRIQSELRTAQIQASALEAPEAGRPLVITAAVEEWLDKEPTLARPKAEITDLEERIADNLRVVVQGDKDPTIRGLREALADARKVLEDRKHKLRPEIEKRLLERGRTEATVRAATTRAGIKLLRSLEAKLIEDMQEQEKEIAVVGKGSLEIETLGEDISQTEEVAKRLGNQMASLKVELEAPARVSLLEEAVVSGMRDEHRQAKAASGAGFAGFALALFGVCWLDARTRRVGNPEEVSRGLNLRLVGTLPNVGGGRPRPGRYGQNQLAESVDTMRTNLLHFAGTESLRSVMVTSALQGEGKTSLSGQLSASLARAGCRTLLVDADLRKPAAHRLFDLPVGPGLSELLRGEAGIEDVIRATPIEGLWLISAGSRDPQAMMALARVGKDIFAQLEDRFDFVIVDSSPVLPVADALLVGQQVDAVIFSVLRDVSRMPALQAAYERMALLGFRILGAAVSGVPGESYGGHY